MEVSIQDFLQGAFLDMFDVLVRAVSDLEAVIGFEVGGLPLLFFWTCLNARL